MVKEVWLRIKSSSNAMLPSELYQVYCEHIILCHFPLNLISLHLICSINPPDDCIEACSPGACCYVTSEYPQMEHLFDEYYGVDQNPIKTCTACNDNIGFCQQYGSCEHLNNVKDTSGLQNDDYTYELQINNVCMKEYIAMNGALQCSNVCQPAHCCFSQDPTCTNSVNCDAYAQCKALYPAQKGVGELLQLAEHINEVCSNALNSLDSRYGCNYCFVDLLYYDVHS